MKTIRYSVAAFALVFFTGYALAECDEDGKDKCAQVYNLCLRNSPVLAISGVCRSNYNECVKEAGCS